MIPTEEEIDRADAAANPDPGSQRQAANQDEAGPSTRGDVEAAGEEAAEEEAAEEEEEEGEEEEPLTWSERVRRARRKALNRPEGNKLVKGRFLWFIAKWDPEAPPGRRGRDAPKLHRHKTMGMLASKDPMYIHFPSYLFEQRMRVRGAVLTGASKAYFTYPSEKALFDGVFLPPVESESFSPQSYAVETLRQRTPFRNLRRHTPEVGAGRMRGIFTRIEKYHSWARHITTVHAGILRQAGIYDAILAVTGGFRRRPETIAGFIQLWSPITNCFHFPFGEMSITLWDLSALCGLPVYGAPLDECSPPNQLLSKLPLAGRLFQIWGQIVVEKKCFFDHWVDWEAIRPYEGA